MCEFKHCKGPDACFLKDISPCPGVCKSAPPEIANDNTPRNRSRSLGFVDRDALARALVPDQAVASVGSVMAVQRVTSKLERALQVMELRALR